MPRHFIAQMIDHTLLQANATERDIKNLCLEAERYQFAAVCTNSFWTGYASSLLRRASVKVASVIGFPLGCQSLGVKLAEAEHSLRAGAHELDLVLNIGSFLSGDESYVREELACFSEMRQKQSRALVVKVILETGYLNLVQLDRLVELVAGSKLDFVKTSTGFGPRGASIEDMKNLMASIQKYSRPSALHIKASGGIRSYREVSAFLEAGATRIGTSSGVAIMRELSEESHPSASSEL